MSQYDSQIVAVDSPSYYFANTYLGKSEEFYKTHSVAAFTFPDIPFSFAYVSTKIASDATYYHLNPLIKPDAVQSNTIVNESTLEGYGPLELRVATTGELKRIREAVEASTAHFSTLYIKPEQPMSILNKV